MNPPEEFNQQGNAVIEQEIQELPKTVSPSPYFQPTIMPSEKADLYDKINPQDIVDYLKFKLMGFEWNNQNMCWDKPTYKKGLTLVGANEITTLMLPVSSKNITISNLNNDEIRNRTKSLHRVAMLMCVKNWRDYGITGSDQIQLVSQIVVSNTFITLKQLEHAGAREFLGKSTSENKSIVEDNQKKGIINGLFRK